jgi:uncharacterized iron-regulated membrane protein
VRGSSLLRLVDATTGDLRSPIDRGTAEAVARADQRGEPRIVSSELITHDPATEYRDQPLPAWRISFDDGAGTRLYVDATNGAVRARRNDTWRLYDFFWMLHTMDYRGRDDFHHPILTAFALLAGCLVVSGFALWGFRLMRRRRRSSAP